jgi:hypothetical protein
VNTGIWTSDSVEVGECLDQARDCQLPKGALGNGVGSQEVTQYMSS